MPWENLNNNTIFWFYIGTSTYMWTRIILLISCTVKSLIFEITYFHGAFNLGVFL